MGQFFGRGTSSSPSEDPIASSHFPVRPPYTFGQFDFRRITRLNWMHCIARCTNLRTQLAVLDRASEVDPLNPLVWAFMCNILVKLPLSLDLATRAFFRVLDRAHKYCPEHRDLYVSFQLMFQGRPDSALELINKEIETFPTFAYAFFMKARLLDMLVVLAPTQQQRLDLESQVAENLVLCQSIPPMEQVPRLTQHVFAGSSLCVAVAGVHLVNGRIAQAITACRKETNYCSMQEVIMEAQAYAMKEEFDLARSVVDAGLERCHYSDRSELMRLKLTNKDLSPAQKEELLKDLLRHNPVSATLWRSYVRLLDSQGRNEEALAAMNHCLNWCEDTDPHDYYTRACLFGKKGDYFKAEVNFRVAVLLAHGEGRYEIYNGILERFLSEPAYKQEDRLRGDWTNMKTRKRLIRLAILQMHWSNNPENDDLYFLVFLELTRFYTKKIDYFCSYAMEHGLRGSFWKALLVPKPTMSPNEALLECVRIYPGWMPPLITLVISEMRMKRSKFFDSTHRYLDELSELAKEECRFNHFLYFLLTGAAIDSERHTDAMRYLKEYEDSLSGDESKEFSLGIYVLKSQIAKKKEDLPLARKLLEEAIETVIQEKHEDVDLGVLYALLSEVVEDSEESFQFCDKASRLNPSLMDPYRRRNKLLLEKGLPKLAAEEMNRALFLRTWPEDVLARAKCRRQLGDPFGAEEDLRFFFTIVEEEAVEDIQKATEMRDNVTRCLITCLYDNLELERFWDVEIVTVSEGSPRTTFESSEEEEGECYSFNDVDEEKEVGEDDAEEEGECSSAGHREALVPDCVIQLLDDEVEGEGEEEEGENQNEVEDAVDC